MVMSDKVQAELDEIDRKIAALKSKRQALEKKAGERLMRIAREVGLLGLSLSDGELRESLKEVAARFRSETKSENGDGRERGESAAASATS